MTLKLSLSNHVKGVFEYIDEYNVDKENKILVVFDDLITDLI